ncbi:hypothetical protein C1645_819074 [Glomus cerebriforme]|uniref:Uncharacterized protein n=1 Tax=Glomus cerebriforme TaxID=658196 RepID=A0A397TBK8_9GLOM|nr:hypothetical protein C1645_819074 [Glomus cerebriforme]
MEEMEVESIISDLIENIDDIGKIAKDSIKFMTIIEEIEERRIRFKTNRNILIKISENDTRSKVELSKEEIVESNNRKEKRREGYLTCPEYSYSKYTYFGIPKYFQEKMTQEKKYRKYDWNVSRVGEKIREHREECLEHEYIWVTREEYEEFNRKEEMVKNEIREEKYFWNEENMRNDIEQRSNESEKLNSKLNINISDFGNSEKSSQSKSKNNFNNSTEETKSFNSAISFGKLFENIKNMAVNYNEMKRIYKILYGLSANALDGIVAIDQIMLERLNAI